MFAAGLARPARRGLADSRATRERFTGSRFVDARRRGAVMLATSWVLRS